MSCPSLTTAALPPCLPLNIKDLVKEDARLLDGGWLAEGKLLERELLKTGFLKGKELLKGNC
jgi:hypothetical protein